MPPQATARSPFAGCLILIAALVLLIFLIGFSAWMPFRQAAEIAKFTETSPAPLAIDPIEGNETAVNALVERLELFRTRIQGDATGTETIELSAADLNLAIAAFEPVKELRGSFRVKEITPEALVIDICYKLNGRPRLAREDEEGPFASDPMYLIGTMRGHPVLARRELMLKVDTLDVPGKSVPDGFMEHFSTLRIFEGSMDHPVLGPAMAALTRAELKDGAMVLSRVPGEISPEVISDEEFDKGTNRLVGWLGVAACIFLVFAATMVFLGIRKQRRAEQEEQTRTGNDGA